MAGNPNTSKGDVLRMLTEAGLVAWAINTGGVGIVGVTRRSTVANTFLISRRSRSSSRNTQAQFGRLHLECAGVVGDWRIHRRGVQFVITGNDTQH